MFDVLTSAMERYRGRTLEISFYAMVQARSCIGEIVQWHARAYQISFYAMVQARSCIGGIVQ